MDDLDALNSWTPLRGDDLNAVFDAISTQPEDLESVGYVHASVRVFNPSIAVP